jgi:CBS domain containing-hemolysin-like protein
MSATDIWLLLLAIVLIGIAGALAGADAALSRVSRLAVERAVRERRRGATELRQIVADPARYLNVALFLRVLCETTAVAVVTVVMIGLVTQTWEAVVIASLAMLVISYVLLGVAPRTLGRQHAARIALICARPLIIAAQILGPLTKLLILIGNALTPGRGFRDGPFTSEAELRDLVDLAEESAVIEDDERQMIHSVFELGDTLAREVMVPRTDMVFIERGKTLRQALSLGLRSGFSRIPVIGENADDVVGVLYLKDVTRRIFDHRDGESTEKVESVMRPPYFVPESKAADDLLKDMQANRTHIAVVVDEYGGVAGIVTIEDVLEEIVGEIADEYDVDERPMVETLPDGCLRVSARLDVEEFGELIGVEFDEDDLDDVETVGGLMAKRLGLVPIPGATIRLDDFALTAESVAGRRNRIGAVLVRRDDGRPAAKAQRDATDAATATARGSDDDDLVDS